MNQESFSHNQMKTPEPGTAEALALDAKLEAMRATGLKDLQEKLETLTPEERTAFEKAVTERDATDPRLIQ